MNGAMVEVTKTLMCDSACLMHNAEVAIGEVDRQHLRMVLYLL